MIFAVQFPMYHHNFFFFNLPLNKWNNCFFYNLKEMNFFRRIKERILASVQMHILNILIASIPFSLSLCVDRYFSGFSFSKLVNCFVFLSIAHKRGGKRLPEDVSLNNILFHRISINLPLR